MSGSLGSKISKTTNHPREGNATGVGAGPSQLTTLHYESLALAAASTGSSLWGQLKEKFPEIRNATQYYAAEAQKQGTALLEHAQQYQAVLSGTTASGGDRSSSEGRSPEPPQDFIGVGANEIHYQPNPLGTLGLNVRSVEVSNLPGSGDSILCMAIDQGIACFEMTETAVFELAVDLGVALNPASRLTGAAKKMASEPSERKGSSASSSTVIFPSGGPNEHIVAVQPLSLDTFIALTSTGWLFALSSRGTGKVRGVLTTESEDLSGPSSVASLNSSQPVGTGNNSSFSSNSGVGSVSIIGFTHANTSSPKSLKLMRGSRGAFAVVSSTEFAQISVFRISSSSTDSSSSSVLLFSEISNFCGETSVIATSGNWLAYAGQTDSVKTHFKNTKLESAAESVAGMALTGLNKLREGFGWGTSPGMNPTSVPLGTVVIFNVCPAPALHKEETDPKLPHPGERVVPTHGPPQGDFACFSAHNHPIQVMKWDGTGTLLATASTQGTSVNVFQVMPPQPTTAGKSSPLPEDSGSTGSRAEVSLVYRLQRGVTQSTICDISFSGYNSWMAVCTSIGTCHFYKIPRSDQMLHGKATSLNPARSLQASCRARSAPSTTPVTPKFLFSQSVLTIGGTLHGVEGALVTASGTVNWISCSEDGAQLSYTKSIDAFSADKEKVMETMARFAPDSESESKGVTDESERVGSTPDGEEDYAASDAQWRAAIELMTHDVHHSTLPSTPLVNTTSSGFSKQPESSTSGELPPRPTTQHVDPVRPVGGNGEGGDDDWDNVDS